VGGGRASETDQRETPKGTKGGQVPTQREETREIENRKQVVNTEVRTPVIKPGGGGWGRFARYPGVKDKVHNKKKNPNNRKGEVEGSNTKERTGGEFSGETNADA